MRLSTVIMFFWERLTLKGTFAHDIDVFKTIRKALITALAEKIGLDLESIRLDWGKIVFSDVSKGSQVRTFGTMRAPG